MQYRPDMTETAAISKWLEEQRGRPQYRPAPHARKAIARIMRPLSSKHGAGSTGLASHWPDIIGSRFASISKPVKFSGKAHERTLLISAPGPAAALIMASSRQIIERANTYLGADHLKRITIVQTKMKAESTSHPAPRGLTQQAGDKLQSGLETVADSDLKAALEKLGRRVLAKDDN